MLRSLAPHTRRLLNSFAYTGLVAVVAALGYLTFYALNHRHDAESTSGTAAESATTPLFELSNFSVRLEKSSDAERLTIAVRLRLTATGSVDCAIYVVARNDHVSPKIWAVWPPQDAAGAMTAGGHFRGNNPTSGQNLQLTTHWTRVTATIDHPIGQPAFDVVTVYLVSPQGEILLSRPFVL